MYHFLYREVFISTILTEKKEWEFFLNYNFVNLQHIHLNLLKTFLTISTTLILTIVSQGLTPTTKEN